MPLWRRLVMKTGKRFLRWAGDFQSRHSLISTTPVIDNSEFAWVPQLENSYDDVRKELDSILENPENIPTFHQLSPDQKRISKGNNWKTFAFYMYGERVDDQILNWKTGEVMLFDDTYEHEVHNDTDETRAILFIDIYRPMDAIGSLFNRLIVRLIQASTYVKQPLKNVVLWNKGQR